MLVFCFDLLFSGSLKLLSTPFIEKSLMLTCWKKLLLLFWLWNCRIFLLHWVSALFPGRFWQCRDRSRYNNIIIFSFQEAWWGSDITDTMQIFSSGVLTWISMQLSDDGAPCTTYELLGFIHSSANWVACIMLKIPVLLFDHCKHNCVWSSTSAGRGAV